MSAPLALAVTLTLLGAVAHAAWNLVATRGRADPRAFALACVLVTLAVTVPPATLGWSLGWVGSGGRMRDLAAMVPYAAVSALLHAAYVLLLQIAYTRGSVAVVYPVARGSGPLLAALAGAVVLAEAIGPLGWAGIALIVAGVCVVSAPSGNEEQSPHAAAGGQGRQGEVPAGVVGGLLVGVSMAAYTLWDDHAVGARGLDPLPYYALGVMLMALLLFASAGRGRGARVRAAVRDAPRAVIAVGVLVPTAYLLTLYALTLAPVAVVAPLRSSSIVIGAVAACVLLGEQHLARRVGAAIVVTVGVVLLAATG